MTVITGPSGSGKPQLLIHCFQKDRGDIESLSTYARRFRRLKSHRLKASRKLRDMYRSEQQRKTPRSTVATSTEIHDYFRLIFAHLGEVHCPECQIKLRAHAPATAMEILRNNEERGWLLAKVQGEIISGELTQNGYNKILVKKEDVFVEKKLQHIEEVLQNPLVVIDRFTPSKSTQRRLVQSIEQAYSIGSDRCCFVEKSTNKTYNFSREATCFEHGTPFSEAPTPRHFSFNTQIGACEKCNGWEQVKIFLGMFVSRTTSIILEAIHGWVKVSLSRSHRFQHLL